MLTGYHNGFSGRNCMDILNIYAVLGLLFVFVQMVFGIVELIIVYVVLRKTPHRLYHLAVPVWILLLGFILMNSGSVTNIIIGSFILIAPMAALLPMYLVPQLTDPETSLGRISISYIAVCVFQFLFVYSFAMSEKPFEAYYFFSGHLYNNALIYTGIVVADILVAFFAFMVLLHLLPFHETPVTKTE